MMKNETKKISDLSLYMQQMLKEEGIEELTSVQSEAITAIETGRDVRIKGPTASGKTYAYLIPALERLEPQGKGKHFPVVLILVPTRELALQTARITRNLLSRKEGIRTAVLCGGEDMNAQVRAFSKGADIVIATPARLLDHIRRHTFKSKLLEMAVIDEADMMLSMGFGEDVKAVSEAFPEVQKILLYATVNEETEKLSLALLEEPVDVEVIREAVHEQKISYYACIVKRNEKLDQLAALIRSAEEPPIVFCNKRISADFVDEQLHKRGINSACIHSEMNQKKRNMIMDAYRQQKYDALCATDVLSRGIDIPFVSCIILYDYPEDPASLIHRTARSSRRTQPSKAVFLLEGKEAYKIKEAEKILNTRIKRIS